MTLSGRNTIHITEFENGVLIPLLVDDPLWDVLNTL